MQDHSKRFLRVLLLFSFVSLMLCPYAEIITASHGGKMLIQQDDFRKTKKLVINDFHSGNPLVYITSTPSQPVPAAIKETLNVMPASHLSIGLSITTTVQLLL